MKCLLKRPTHRCQGPVPTTRSRAGAGEQSPALPDAGAPSAAKVREPRGREASPAGGGRKHSPNKSSLSSRRASFRSRRSCRSISALMRWDSFSSADRQQQPAMTRATPDGATPLRKRRSSARPICAGHRGLERKAPGRFGFRIFQAQRLLEGRLRGGGKCLAVETLPCTVVLGSPREVERSP